MDPTDAAIFMTGKIFIVTFFVLVGIPMVVQAISFWRKAASKLSGVKTNDDGGSTTGK